MTDIKEIITVCFESEEMQDYLIDHSSELTKAQIEEIIRGAPIPLARKTELMKGVNEQSHQDMKNAFDALKLDENQFLFFSMHGYELIEGKLEPDEWGIGPCKSLEQVRRNLARDWYDLPESEDLWGHRFDALGWGVLNLYEPNDKGGFRNPYTYYLIADQVCYFEKNTKMDEIGLCGYCNDFCYSWDNIHLNINIPFEPGDIVTVDSRPFAKPQKIVLLEVGPDCCGVQALYRNEAGEWNTGAVKHGTIYPEVMAMISPLYRMRKHIGPLEESEKQLEVTSHALNSTHTNMHNEYCK